MPHEPHNRDGNLERWLRSDQPAFAEGTRFAGLDGLSKAFLAASLTHRNRRPLLVVFASRADARNFLDDYAFFAGRERDECAHYIPCLDFDFHRGLLPNPELLCERNVGLFRALNDPEGRCFVTTVRALMQKVVPEEEFLNATQVLKKGGELDRDALILSLQEAGYQRQPTAYDPGVFAVRGGVVDVFCPLYRHPLRIELFGDEIEELRFFDSATQRSLEEAEKAYLIPVGQTLIPHGPDYQTAAEKLKVRLDALGVPKHQREELLERISEGHSFSELSLLFPLLSKGSVSPFRYFPEETLVLWDGREALKAHAREAELPSLERNFGLYEKEPVPIAEKKDLFTGEAELEEIFSHPAHHSFEMFETPEAPVLSLNNAEVRLAQEREALKQHKGAEPVLSGFARRFREWMDMGYAVHIVCHTANHAERIQMLFEPYQLKTQRIPEGLPAFPALLDAPADRMNLWIGYLTGSRMYPSLNLVVLSEEEIFGHKKRVAKSSAWNRGKDVSQLLSAFRDLKIGDLVVHKDHGIGKYLGLKSMEFQGTPNDYVLLEYRDGDKLYVPVYRLNVLQKYSASEGAAPVLDKLGGDRWIKAKKKAEKAVAALAADLLNLQAKRRMIPAHAYSPPGQDFHEFEMEFPFDETPDQLKTIEEVNEDLGKSHPMDRLICGDVGYGKTEVAMRAAFRCVLDKKQVAVLVPTTVLAFQHFESFRRRFASTGARIEMVSRLRSPAQIREVLGEVKAGKVDILIGTHRLLSSDVQFRDLGLIVVDEEHRFGVVHKEKLKKISQSVHFLSMTATPIPRTLNMAMTGIKDISVITTPPPDRLSVRTFVCRRTPEVIQEAIGNELARDGQIFFVHNRIQSLEEVAGEIREWFPKVRFEMVHGQMEPEELEPKMLAFYRGEAKILLTTAIIESGLDVPNANTMIIDRSDHFGLAQLYQLRGRVGRSEKRAYCYLLVPNEHQMTRDAKERLQVIQRYTDLGSGFHVASHDLELRGAGDLLGKEQSGHLTAVGVDYYFELLEDSIRELKGQEKRIDIEPEINLKIAAFLPESYVPDISSRIAVYRRLSAAEDEETLSEVEQEIRDRFGPPPEEVTNLFGLMTLKLYLKRLHVVRMGCGPKRTSLQFAPTTPASPDKLVRLIQKQPKRYSVTPDQKLVFEAGDDASWHGQLKQVKNIARELGVRLD